MTVKEGAIVVRISDNKATPTNYRVEAVNDRMATIRSLADYRLTNGHHVDELSVRYYTDYFDFGDTVRVRKEYAGSYNEADGGNELTVIANSNTSGRASTTQVANNNGEEFNILTERLHLVRPVKNFKAGDRVVVDLDLAKKYGNDGIAEYWGNTGPLVLTEDSGSRLVQITSNVRYENAERESNNVPTRWLKLAEDAPKRVVGETIKVKDIKSGDKVKSTQTINGMLHELTGVVGDFYKVFGIDSPTVVAVGGGVFPYESKGAIFTLLEEAPEPVDENLQRLLDAEIGDIAHGTYAGDYYWKKVGADEWKMVDDRHIYDTEAVFEELFKVKYGELHIYRKVESDN